MDDLVVYKSNSLVQAGYKLSVNEQRIILNCISKLNRSGSVTDEKMYRISVQEILEGSEVNLKNAYQKIKLAVSSLFDRKVSIYEKNSNEIIVTRWVQTIKYLKTEACIELRFSKDILPYLTQLKEQFTKYKLKHVSNMKSSYGIRLYELLIQYKQVGLREIEIKWLRTQLKINDQEYPRMYDFKKRIIDPAVNDINETSDIWVSYTQRKTGRRVTHLSFEFGLKSTSKTKPKRLTKKYIEQNSFPGESWENAKKRLSEEMV